MLRLAALVIAAFLITACASQPETEAVSGLHYNHKAKLKIIWRQDLGEGAKGSYLRLQPSIQDGTVYSADPSGQVQAITLKNGHNQWQVKLENPISAGVTIAGKCLLISTENGFLHCLNINDGTPLWQARLPSESISPASADATKVFVHSIDGRITAFDLSAGQQLWSYESAMPVLTLRGTGSPLVLDQLVVVGFASGKLIALDKQLGVPRWDVRLASPDGRSELERLVDIDGQPVWQNGVIYAASYHGKIAAVSLRGETLWEEDGSSYTSPELSLGSVYLTLDDDTIQAYDSDRGEKIWQQPALKGRKLGQVSAYKSYLTVADNDGNLYLLSQINGELVNYRLLRPKPLHVNYPNRSDATRLRALRGLQMGIRSNIISTAEGLLVYTNSGEMMLLAVKEL